MLGVIHFGTFVDAFWHLWPLLLVCIGLSIIGSNVHHDIFNLLASLCLSATLLVGCWWFAGITQPLTLTLPTGASIELSLPQSPQQDQALVDRYAPLDFRNA
jgi:hypothetical protein